MTIQHHPGLIIQTPDAPSQGEPSPQTPAETEELDRYAAIDGSLEYHPSGKWVLFTDARRMVERQQARIAELTEERKDWARRFRLDGTTPWDWQRRALNAERAAVPREKP